MAASVLSFREDGAQGLGGMIGSRQESRYVWQLVQMVARTDSAVFIQGETGTGKKLLAKAIHEGSLRSHGPFVKVNCAAIPAGLLESELFGRERGAYTGAANQAIGRFERAHMGLAISRSIVEAHGGQLWLDQTGGPGSTFCFSLPVKRASPPADNLREGVA